MSDANTVEELEQPIAQEIESSGPSEEAPQPPKLNSTEVFVYRPAPVVEPEVKEKFKPSTTQLFIFFILSAGITTLGFVSLGMKFVSGETGVEIAGSFGELLDKRKSVSSSSVSEPEQTTQAAAASEEDASRGRLAPTNTDSTPPIPQPDVIKVVIRSNIQNSGILKATPSLDTDELAAQIITAAEKYSFDPLLLTAIIQTESSFNSNAQSGDKTGLLQLRFSTAKEIAERSGVPIKDKSSLKDPSTNLDVGTNYLSQLLARFGGNQRQMLLAYNWDPSKLELAIEKGTMSPDATRKYATRVQKRFQALSEQTSSAPSPVSE